MGRGWGSGGRATRSRKGSRALPRRKCDGLPDAGDERTGSGAANLEGRTECTHPDGYQRPFAPVGGGGKESRDQGALFEVGRSLPAQSGRGGAERRNLFPV